MKEDARHSSIGILTFYNTTNYGALLQMYALYNVLCEKQVNPEIVRYYCEAVETRENLKIHKANSIKQLLRILILKIPNTIKQKKFRDFESRYFRYSERFYTKDSLPEIKREYDAVIVGSDQVWNLKLTGGDKGFFLENVSGISKYSYAASFGGKNVTDEEAAMIKPLLERFDKISVRETSGVTIVEKICGINPEFVLDPTFLLAASEWDKVAGKSLLVKKPYILLYLIQNKKKTVEYAIKFSKKMGWVVKYVNISPYHVSGVENMRYAAPEEFLQLVRGASLVITGSYHGLALSVNYSKPVYYELSDKEKNYNARISSLISTLNMQRCKLDYGCFELPEIDYTDVQTKLTNLRNRSKEVLYSMIRGV